MAEIRFDDRVAIVTGAGGGLGREHALLLASRGARVVVNDLGGAADGTGASAGPAERTVKEIEDLGGTAVASADSVATPRAARRSSTPPWRPSAGSTSSSATPASCATRPSTTVRPDPRRGRLLGPVRGRR